MMSKFSPNAMITPRTALASADKVTSYRFSILTPAILFLVLSFASIRSFAQLAGYSYRVKITISGSQVCGASTLTNFPLLIQTTATFLRPSPTGLINNANGYDIAFTASDGTTLLNHQIDHYNSATGEYAAWVRIPSLPPGSDTDIYMYYGNPSVSTNPSSTGTWNANFRTVYHFQSSSFNDGTANAINSANNGTTTVGTAKIGEGRDFNGTTNYIQTNSNDLKTANNFTISAWFKADQTVPGHIIWEGLSTANGWGTGAGGDYEMNLSTGTCCPGSLAVNDYLSFYLGDREEQVSTDVLDAEAAFTNTSSWQYVVATVTNLNTSPVATLYLNGTQIATNAGVAGPLLDRTAWDTNLRIGRSGPAGTRFFDGQVDEVRISNVVRPAGWICTEYNNQNSPGSFFTFVNDPPDLNSIEGTGLNYSEGNPATTITSTTTVTDENDATLASATIWISNNYVNGEDVLSFTNTASITGSWNAAAGTLTLTGVTTLANYQAALRAVKYQNTNNANPSSAVRTVSFRVNDGTANSNVVTRNINVIPVNDTPTASNDSYSTNEDTPLSVLVASGVLNNDNDIDGDALTAVLVSTTPNGSLTLNANGSFTYTPNANFNGSDNFTYRANDGTVNSTTATVTITVNAVNDAPVAADDTYSTNEDVTLTVSLPASGVLSNDSDVDGNPLTTVLVATTSNGSLTLNANGTFTYVPNANFNGSDSFTYRANDGTVNSGIATVTITVNAVNDAPVAVNDAYSTNEDVTLTVSLPASGVLNNDTDVDGNPLTAILVATTSNGSLTLNADGTFTYVPDADYNGSDSFTYRANDGTVNSGIATVTITVNAVNDAPAAVDDAYSTNEDVTLTVSLPASGVLNNDTDVDGNPLTAVLVSSTSNGSLTLNANGTFTYVPNANFNGSDSFTYRANDGTVNSGIATVTITVNAVNDAPVAVDDAYNTNEDATLTVVLPASGVLNNDTDIDLDLLTAVLIATTSNGGLTFNADGTFTYVPNANFNGSDSFTYRANDGTANSGIATVTITVNAVNDAPVAVDDAYNTNEDVTLTVALPASGVLGNDSDVDADPMTAVLVATTSNGALTLNADGTFTYVPDANFNGSDSFTYRANDGTVNSGIATVTITVNAVNDAPVAVDDAYSTNEDVTLTVALPASGVLNNDSDIDADPLTAVVVATTSNGTLTLNADGTFTYVPTANFNGSDSFTYRANDGTANSGIATVTITVNAVNDAPVAVDDAYNTNEDVTLTVALPASGVLNNDSDIDADPLTAVLVATTSNGALTLNADGTFTYIPNANFNGSDSFTYRANDGTANSGIATVTITVNAVNDAPVAVDDAYSTNEDVTLTVALPASGVLNNDSDIDADPLTAVVVATTSNGALTLNADGTFTYVPTANFNGSDSFTYRANDGTANSGIATVTITVNAVNDAPVAVDDAYNTNEDVTLTVALPASGVLNNDSDIDADPLTTVVVATTSNGALTLNADGTFTYVPNANFNGSDSFTYRANDGTANSGIATVTITVNAVNDAPVAVDDAYSTNEDVTLTVALPASGVLNNDSDIDADPLTAVVVATTSNGSLTLNADGTFTYVPTANFNGSDSFTYRANDGTANSGIATVTITVNAVNDAPVAINDAYNTNEDVTLTVALPASGVLNNDSDIDADPLTAVVVATTSNGALTLNADGTFTYVPNANFNGSDSFTYRANDGTANSGITTVTITVNAVNDAPVAIDDAYSTNEDITLTVALPASGVLNNDSDIDADPLTAVVVATTSNGALTLNADGTFTYVPNANFNGSDSFTYQADDGTASSGIATVTITVNAINDAPVAVNDTYNTNEDVTLSVVLPASGVLNNDTDVDADPMTAVLIATTSNGSLTLNADGTFTYIPNANFNGSDGFTYRANDGTANSGIAAVTITVNAVNDAPAAVDDAYSTNEDVTLTVALPASGVLNNDSDIDADPLTAVLVGTASNGTLMLNANGTFTYTPNANFNGSDNFTYRANDGTANSGIATVTVTVNPVNDAPVAINDSYNTSEDNVLTVLAASGVLANDTDIDGNPLTATLVSTTSNGSLTFNADGSFTYTPDADYTGSDSFTYRNNDGTVNSGIATVTINIGAANDAPVATDDAYSTNEDVTLTVSLPASGVLNNDSDADANPLTAVLGTTTLNGTLTLNANGTFTYVPNANFNGSDSFTYTANDGTVNSAPATVTITVNPMNDTPVAVNDAYSTNEDATLTVALPASGVLNNDSDIDGNPLTAVVGTTTTNGTLTLNANGTFTYVPNANFNGSDSFTYTANDGTVNSAPATVTITVNPMNDTPVASNDAYNTDEDVTLTAALPASGVLNNDSDVDADPLTAVLGSTTTNGTLTLNANGTFTYVPNANFNGSDSFTYTANDGTVNSTPATVTITVNSVNDAPVAVDDAYNVNEDNTLTILAAAGVLNNDSDVEGGVLDVLLVSTTTNGTLTLNSDGSFTYIPNAAFNGSDSFVYNVVDTGSLTSNDAIVTITVNPVNDTPVAADDAYSTNEDVTLTVALPASGVLNNDSDIDSDPLTAVLGTTTTNGTLTLNANGTFTYVPDADFNGTDSFTYTANDGTVNSAPATVIITVNPVNDTPGATDDAYNTNEDATLTVALPSSGVLNNDSDIDGDPLTAVLGTTTTNGTLTLNADGTFTYTPNANFNGSDSFTYTANDGTVNSAPATVTITVNPVNDAPVAVNDSYNTNEDVTLTVALPASGVLNNDSDIDSDPLTAVIATTTSNGTLTLNADGTFTYVPNADFNGTDAFTYTANDGTVNSAPATVTITVNPVNDTPVAVDDSYSTNEDATLTIALPASGVLNNDSDIDSDPLTAVLGTTTTNGTLTLNADGTFTYVPNADFNGSDSFTYTANDGTGNSAPATVTITINPVNDAPVATDDSYSTNEDVTLTVALPASGVRNNDSDIDSDPLTAVIATTTNNGTLTLNADGTFTYVPNVNFNGADAFTYTANDGTVNSVPATVTITVNPVNDTPVAVDDSYSTNEDVTLTIALPASGVLNNDSDVDSDPLTAVPGTTTTNGTLTLNADGTFTYVPNANFNGSDSFTYTANDGTINSAPATVTITVDPVNDVPVATDDAYVTDEDVTLTIALPASGVLNNDSDTDGDPLTASLATPPANGTVTLNADGTFTYVPNTNFNGGDSFTYTANDGSANSASATVTITVNAINDAPVANDDVVSTEENTSIDIDVLPNDIDVDSPIDPSSVLITSPAANGTLSVNTSTGVITYTPTAAFIGNDSFTYTITDGGSLTSNNGTVNITVTPVNDPPVAVDDGPIPYSSVLPLTVDVLANDSDPDNTLSELEIVSVTSPAFGSVSIVDNKIVYQPSGSESGTVTFSYTIQDPGGLTASATVFIDYEYQELKASEGFSPNGDGNNDTWYIRSIEAYPNNQVQIFDRWGILVYKASHYDNMGVIWNGRANIGQQAGELLDRGTYYYVIDLGNNSKAMSGYVVIIR